MNQSPPPQVTMMSVEKIESLMKSLIVTHGRYDGEWCFSVRLAPNEKYTSRFLDYHEKFDCVGFYKDIDGITAIREMGQEEAEGLLEDLVLAVSDKV